MPDPRLDDDPRIRAAVVAFAERRLDGLDFEPIPATLTARRQVWLRAGIALGGLAAAAALILPLAVGRFSLVPARPADRPDSGLSQCLADLTADDVVPSTPKLTVGDLRIVGSVVTRYRAGQVETREVRTAPVPVVASDDATGETVRMTDPASKLIWQTVEPDNREGNFTTESDLQAWVKPTAVVPHSPGDTTFAVVFQQAAVTVNLQVRCGGSTRNLTVTGTKDPVLPDRDTASITAVDCGPNADVSDLSDELAAFARTCDSLA